MSFDEMPLDGIPLEQIPLYEDTPLLRADFAAMGLEMRRDVAYGAHPRQRLDIFRPAGGDNLPLLVWIHDGGWTSEELTKAYLPEAQLAAMSQRGFAVASIEYRLAQHAPFPGPVADCQSAVRFLRAHAAEFGIDPRRIGLCGESAGGHLVALMGVAPDRPAWLDASICPEVSSRVQAVCAWYAPADMLASAQASLDTGRGAFAQLFGAPLSAHLDAVWEASPLRYAQEPGKPPFLLMHGDWDRIVPHWQSRKFCAALQAGGNDAQLCTLHRQGHGFLKDPHAYDVIYDFFARHLKG